MVKDTGTIAISVEYRLAPENAFPTPLQDCVAVTKYFLNNAAEKFGVDSSRVVLAGESAGGNLAAAVSMKLSMDDFPLRPKLQVLLYPALQAINLQTPSYQANKNGPWLTHEEMAFFYANYAQGQLENMGDYLTNKHVPKEEFEKLMDEFMPLDALPNDDIMANHDQNLAQSAEEPPYWNEIRDIITDPLFSPLLASDEILLGSPTTYVSACQYDVLRDDAVWYARRLRAIGVLVELDVEDCFHAWGLFTEDIQSADKIMRRMTDFINTNL